MNPRKRLLRIISELKQLIVDKESWNDNRTDAAPFDVGADKVALKMAKDALAALDSGDKKRFWAARYKLIVQLRESR